jgi:hypothetical protein
MLRSGSVDANTWARVDALVVIHWNVGNLPRGAASKTALQSF